MARVNEESIDTFISITRVAKEVAMEILEEHGGDLNAAVNAHFSGDRSAVSRPPVAAPQDDAMDIDDPVEVTDRRDPFSILSESPMINPFAVLDPQFNTSPLGSDSRSTGLAPFVSQPREVREIPVEFKDSSDAPGRSGHGPILEDVTGTDYAHGPAVHSNVVVDVDDNDINNAADSTSHTAPQSEHRNGEYSWPSAPVYDDTLDYANDIEEQMIRAAIEASKREAQMAEQERASHEQRRNEASEASEAANAELGDMVASNGRLEEGSTSIKDVDEQPLPGQRSRRTMADSMEPPKEIRAIDDSPPSSPGRNDEINGPNRNGESFYSEEWGGISSLEHDEAVMLEAAMFGGVPEGTRYRSAFGPHQFMQTEGPYPRRMPRPPSPSLQAQRSIRKQQDYEYNAALAADREKEMKALEEAKARRLQEEEARTAALEEERRNEEESKRKLEEEQELERQLAAKEASLPQEPAADDENAITLLVRMPDGSRRGRRFLKSDPLQFLFDYIDIGRVIKPGTYRFVRPYPRRAFSNGESTLTLNELGLTSKQEALFLESI